jgi:molybdenum cofactor cytidylyltransferase
MPPESDRTRVSAVVLAAGMSKRMGQIKQLLPLGETTLLGHVLAAVQSSQADECLLILGSAAEAIKEKVALNNVKVVVNEAYSEGMSTSLRAGLANVAPQADGALIILADQPFVKAATIDRLIEEYKKSRPQVAIPVHQGFRGNPVLLDRSVFAEAMGIQGDIGCRAIFGNRVKNVLKVPVDDAGILIDADSPEEFDRLSRAWAEDKNAPATLLESKSDQDRQIEVAVEAWPSQPDLLVVGSEPVLRILVKLAKELHFTITVVDPLAGARDFPDADKIVHRLNLPSLPISGGTFVVVASRGRFDEDAIEQALITKTQYIALVSNKKRADEIRRNLEAKGGSAERLAALRSPAGLQIGATTPGEIALSIVAEIVQHWRRQKDPQQELKTGS